MRNKQVEFNPYILYLYFIKIVQFRLWNIRFSSPTYGVFISQRIRYARACSSYKCFILRARLLSIKLLKREYLLERLKSSFRKLYGRYGDLIQQCEVPLACMWNDILILDQQWLPNQSDFPPISWPWYWTWPSPIMSGLHGEFAMGVVCQQGTLTLPDTWFRPTIVGLACAPIVETRFLEVAMYLLDFSPRIPLSTFSILLLYTTGQYSEQPPEQPAHTSREQFHERMDVKIVLMFIVAVTLEL